jgi:hypothetical protein
MKDTTGVVYVATRKEHYIAEAFLSAHSVKDLAPDLPITLFTDRVGSPFAKGDCFDEIIPIETNNKYRLLWAEGQLDRIKCLNQSPYARTLHLDTDTRVLTPAIKELFSKLDTIDIAMAECQPDASICATHYGRPMFNVGVILYRRSNNVGQLLKAWEELTRQYFDLANLDVVPKVDCLPAIEDPELRRKLLFMDQTSMVQLLSPEVNKFELKLEILHESWNFRGAMNNRKLDQPVKINHHPNLRNRLVPDVVDRALRYQRSGKTQLAREIYQELLRQIPGPNERAALKKLFEQS